MASGRPIYEPNVAAQIAGHRYAIERLQRRNAGGITYDTDNIGDWLYVETSSHFSYGTEIPLDPLYGQPQGDLSSSALFGIALVDKSGYGAVLAVELPSGFGDATNGARITADAEFAHGGVVARPGDVLARAYSTASDFSTSIRAEMLLEATADGTSSWYARARDAFPAPSGALWALWVDDVELFGNITYAAGEETGFSFSPSSATLFLGGDTFLDYEHSNHSLYLHPSGNIIMDTLPTSDPGVSGALWNDSGIVKVS